ncbi:MarR family winged helix-turn-helix transcriptional regulator [Marinibactrum halimedae]|uniref:Transcriptional regulator n=1 Tax=Marinibactrum halimedae TaxID=1444977 RepID=A0AA37T440_9GAMM|nr:MarR family transcriptional regulator [Marinibactrum halimedae]MCD9459057.1 MarR family transcriptional regulator [Marinibactrum halimedae]GLS24658.1 transcriptional regulator [Marinibactrum halimedae]
MVNNVSQASSSSTPSTTKDDPLALSNQLCFSLYATSLAMTQLYKPLLEPHGLTYPQYLILLILWESDGLMLRDIADRLGQKPGAVTPVVKRMEIDGWVVRHRSLADERQLEICLTKKGKRLRKTAIEINACISQSCHADVKSLMSLKNQLDDLRKELK